jgi:predicted ArsR family transcriptional regulator
MASDVPYGRATGATSVVPHEGGAVRRRPTRTHFAKTERLRGLVLEVLAATPSGLSADEIAATLDESVLAVRPRVSELFHAGLIEKTGERRRNRSGLSAHVWKKPAAGAP